MHAAPDMCRGLLELDPALLNGADVREVGIRDEPFFELPSIRGSYLQATPSWLTTCFV